jgi:hypothetical protein
MPKKYIVFYKSIGRKWFLFLVVAIFIVAIYSYYKYKRFEAAIVITVISLILLILSYIPSLFFTRKLMKLMKIYYRIEDKTIGRLMNKSLQKIQEKMFDLSQKQVKKKKWQFWLKNKNWLIIYLDKQYIFYHQQTISRFKELYYKGFGDKEILEQLKEYELKSKAEVKAITEELIKYDKLSEREISVKERREKERFRDL